MPAHAHRALALSFAAALACSLASAPSRAADAADAGAAAAPDYTLTSNLALVSQYVFRGITYSQKRPAVQGGFDFVHASGAYAGVWGSSVSSEALSNAVAEFDLYGGYAGTIGDLAYDVGLLQFTYPRAKFNGESYDTLELYAGLTWQLLNLKYSHELSDYFGMNRRSMGSGDDSKGSHYLEANVNWTFVPTWTLNLHAGRQHVESYDAYDFSDYKVGVTKDIAEGWQLAAAAVTTTGKADLYRINGIDTAGRKWIASVKRTF